MLRAACCVGALAMMVVASAARADDASPLLKQLSAMPVVALGLRSEPLIATVVDLSAARALLPAGSTMTANLMERLSAGDQIRPFDEWRRHFITGEWEKQLDVEPSQIDAFIGYGSPPNDTAIWLMRDETSAKVLFDGLSRRGFAAINGDMAANGTPYVLGARRPGDPWRGALGKASVVARQGRSLLQAQTPQSIAMARLAVSASATSHPAVGAILRGVEVLSMDGMRVVQAHLLTSAIGRNTGDAAALLSGSPNAEDLRKRMEEQRAQNKETGLPVYTMALVADIEAPGKKRGVAVVFTHLDCAQAQTSATRFAQRWFNAPSALSKVPLARLVQAELMTRTVSGSAFCLSMAVLTQSVPASDDILRNEPWDVIVQAIWNRDFVAATIAPP